MGNYQRRHQLVNILPQNSIYHASEETVPEPQMRSELIYAKEAYSDGIETALSILLRTGWSPEITDEHTKYMSIRKENQIVWWEIQGDHSIPIKRKHKKRGRRR